MLLKLGCSGCLLIFIRVLILFVAYELYSCAVVARRAAVAAALELADWDIEPLLRLPLQPASRIRIRSFISPIHP